MLCYILRATSHTRLKVLAHCNLRALIGWKGGDRPSSLHTRRWRPKGPKKDFMDEKSTWSLTWWTMDKVSWSLGICVKPTSWRWAWQKFQETIIFYNIFFQYDKFQNRLQGRFHDRFQDIQTPPSNSTKLIEFETYYIKPNPPLFSVNKICNDPATWSILTSHYAWWPVTAKNDFPNTHESQGSSALQGHGSWLVCEVNLSYLFLNWYSWSFQLHFIFGWKETTCRTGQGKTQNQPTWTWAFRD